MSAVPKAIAVKVDSRDQFRCVNCGARMTVVSGSRHHRMVRGIGGHRVSNLILLCGSGTTGCHGWVHSHPVEARRRGLIIPANHRPQRDPMEVPVMVLMEGIGKVWLLLDDDGGFEIVREVLALELLVAFGMRPFEEVGV